MGRATIAPPAGRRGWVDWLKAIAIGLVVYWHLHPLPESGGALGSLAHFERAALRGETIPYWRLDNFLVLVPLADALARAPERLARWRVALVAVWLLAAAQDLALERYLGRSPYRAVYGRPTVVLGA